MTDRGSSSRSRVGTDVHERVCGQSGRRTTASASAQVGSGLGYQAAGRRALSSVRWGWARRVTTDNRPSSAGGGRRMARSDHGRCVATPRWRRTAANGTASGQRCTHPARSGAGATVVAVHSSAWGGDALAGARMRTPRRGTDGSPVCYQTAGAATTATVRAPGPSQGATVTVVHAGCGSAALAARGCHHGPVRRGRPR